MRPARPKEAVHTLTLAVNQEAVDKHLLLIPVYRRADRPLAEQRAVRKFEIATAELALLRS
jgi:hypothetical protein